MGTHHDRYNILNILGPILGGVITQKSTWRWIYLFNAPAAVAGVTALLIAWPKSPKRKAKVKRPATLFVHVDVLGALLLLLASTLLVFALQEAGARRYNWDSPMIIATLVVSGTCWCTFIVWIFWLDSDKSRVQIKPIFPISVSLNRPTGPSIL
jgi:MFS family permease